MTKPTLPTRAVLAALACAAALAAAGCGGSDGSTGDGAATAGATTAAAERGRAVTDEQALTLARVLQLNWQRGGASFAGTAPVHGTEVELDGRIDFRRGHGEAVLRDPTGQTRRYVWTQRTVRAQAEPGSRRYVAQAPDPDGDPVHAAIAFLNLLSAETIDNTTNIKDQDARHLRAETVDGAPVDVYRYGAGGRTTYWVGRDDGLLRRAEGEFPDGRMTVTLTGHRPVRIALPRASG